MKQKSTQALAFGSLSTMTGRHFSIFASLEEGSGVVGRSPKLGARLAECDKFVDLIMQDLQVRSGRGRVIVDFADFAGNFGPFAMDRLMLAMQAADASLFLQFSASEDCASAMIPSLLSEFIKDQRLNVSLRINHAFFGDAADLVSKFEPAVVSLDFRLMSSRI
jgi:hypothetical protein